MAGSRSNRFGWALACVTLAAVYLWCLVPAAQAHDGGLSVREEAPGVARLAAPPGAAPSSIAGACGIALSSPVRTLGSPKLSEQPAPAVRTLPSPPIAWRGIALPLPRDVLAPHRTSLQRQLILIRI